MIGMSRNREGMSTLFISEIATFQDQNEKGIVLSIIFNFTLKKNLTQIFLLTQMCK